MTAFEMGRMATVVDAQQNKDRKMKLVIIMGLSASGKSTLVQKKANELGLADVQGKKRLTDITLGDAEHRERVKVWLRDLGKAVIDTACCNPVHGGRLDDFLTDIRAEFPDVEVELICFENNPLQCIKNALADKSRGDCGALARVRQICRDCDAYRIPEGATVIPVAVAAS